MKEIFQNSFWQLCIVYTIAVCLLYFGIIEVTLPFQIFAVILALFGIHLKEKNNKEYSLWLLGLALLFTALLRIIPYLSNSVPLGYDAGIYKYVFEFHAAPWIAASHPPLLKFLVAPFMLFGDWFVLVPLFIIIDIILMFTLYLCVKEWFGNNAGIMSAIIFSISYTQFLAFWFLYYKNIVALIFLLLAFYVYKKVKKEKVRLSLFILLGTLVGGTHRPTFLVFVLTYVSYIIFQKIKKETIKGDIISLISIALLTAVIYLPSFSSSILSFLPGITTASIGAGTFISYETFSKYSLAYFPLALLGCFSLIKQKKNSPFLWWFGIVFLIVIGRVIFFNRFIIHLDIALIILSGIGAIKLFTTKTGKVLLILLLIASAFFVVSQAVNDEPLISEEEFKVIKEISTVTEEDALILSTHKHYSPWLLGYAEREVMAPGLFNDPWEENDWEVFWQGNSEKLTEFDRPVYIYIGDKQTFVVDECFKGERLKKFIC